MIYTIPLCLYIYIIYYRLRRRRRRRPQDVARGQLICCRPDLLHIEIKKKHTRTHMYAHYK